MLQAGKLLMTMKWKSLRIPEREPAKLGNHMDHIMSERKRRQLFAERFIALSAIIPGLKFKKESLQHFKKKRWAHEHELVDSLLDVV
ncbi:hypothetical protein JHK82_016216 [Glycine max]|nr:hypothetical protein JHK87_016150 [Glycine soja]KAG5032636.1 hypothetical protein JHK85_016618 [Glycine max]KAG5046840.1 hypothetical protein JHK86_016246 [Glycine max]KAG5149335.1 hypothetical protein JHK82_016216 [Glycine max]